MHAANSTTINPCSIIVHHHSHAQPQFLSIFSHHYEALHYVLFFPRGEIGWGLTAIDDVPNLSQINWYHSRLLADNDRRFTLLGRLCCEYLVETCILGLKKNIYHIFHANVAFTMRSYMRHIMRTLNFTQTSNYPPASSDHMLGRLNNQLMLHQENMYLL